MVTIIDELIKAIKTNVFSLPIKDVRKPYTVKSPTYPMITVREMTNTPIIQLQGEEKLSQLAYRFEIYSRDLSHEGKVYTAEQVNSTLLREIDEFLRKTYGFRRVGDIANLPHSGDSSIMRCAITYVGKIDNNTMIIYQ